MKLAGEGWFECSALYFIVKLMELFFD